MQRKILLTILDILADTYGFEGDFAHQLAVGMPDGNRIKFGVSSEFEYTMLYFIGLRNYLTYSILKKDTKKFSSKFLCN